MKATENHHRTLSSAIVNSLVGCLHFALPCATRERGVVSAPTPPFYFFHCGGVPQALDGPGDRENVWTRLAKATKVQLRTADSGTLQSKGGLQGWGGDVLPAPPRSKGSVGRLGAAGAAVSGPLWSSKGNLGGISGENAAAAGPRIPMTGPLAARMSLGHTPGLLPVYVAAGATDGGEA